MLDKGPLSEFIELCPLNYYLFINLLIYYIHFEIIGDPCDLFTNHTIFCPKLHLFLSQWKRITKTAQPNTFQILFIVTNQIASKMDVIKW